MTENFKGTAFEKPIPAGGIATGNIYIDGNGAFSFAGSLTKKLFFAVKAEKQGEIIDSRVLQSSQTHIAELGCFENKVSSFLFPFAQICFQDSSFPADIKMNVFSPFIPLGDTDSGIPAVIIEYVFTGKSNGKVDFSLCAVAENEHSSPINRMGCTETGEAYIFMTGPERRDENICISTDGKNVSFCERFTLSEFPQLFRSSQTLENNIQYDSVNASGGALCNHFSLEKDEKKTVRFCVSLYKPFGKYTRNYYAQYFESSIECASYFFRHYDRLYSESRQFSDALFGSTLPEEALSFINNALLNLKSPDFTRLDNGALFCENGFPESTDSLCDLAMFFPEVAYSCAINLMKNSSDAFGRIDFSHIPPYNEENENCVFNLRKQLICLIICFEYFKSNPDTDKLFEDWYYISRCADFIFDTENENLSGINTDSLFCDISCRELCVHTLSGCILIASKAQDKKRFEAYSGLYEKAKQYINNSDTQQSDTDAEKDLCSGATVSETTGKFSGFYYNGLESSIGFKPLSDICPLDIGETFRCFFSTGTAYGYVEEGIDYIEVNLLYGKLNLRSFSVPRKPRLVQYGGRNWRFSDKGLCAYLDSELEITPRKKLTIFIDIKEQEAN